MDRRTMPPEISEIDIIAGHPALNFINTVEGRGELETVDYLCDYRRLVLWSVRLGLVEADERDALLAQAEHDPRRAQAAHRRAITLRECLNGVFRAVASQRPPKANALEHLNETVIAAKRHRRLEADDEGGFSWRWMDAVALDRPTWQIALAAASLLTDDWARGRTRICANGPCDWLFLDNSRNGRRRWCRMNVCGNVTKVRRYRERRHD
jgi:predicted RNA-binding Zn ribbon-like protein